MGEKTYPKTFMLLRVSSMYADITSCPEGWEVTCVELMLGPIALA